eukprot:scaffold2050_cov167-Amphora_coffeaeformis.AAC.8
MPRGSGGEPSLLTMNSIREGAVDSKMMHLLTKAVEEEEASHVEFLLRNGAKAGIEHLTRSVAKRDAEKVHVLLLADTDGTIFSVPSRQKTLLFAIRLGSNAGVVAKLLHRGIGKVNPNFCSDDDGKEFPLHLAIKDLEVVRLLLRHGADANPRNALGDTPLHMVENNTAVARLLLDYAADPDHRNGEGLTSLHVACQNNCLAVAKELDGADPSIYDNDGGVCNLT